MFSKLVSVASSDIIDVGMLLAPLLEALSSSASTGAGGASAGLIKGAVDFTDSIIVIASNGMELVRVQ